MKRNILLFLLLAAFGGTCAWAASPATPIAIVAVVDDQAISSVDLNDRMLLTMALIGMPDTPENRAKLTPQILRQLVEEKLQMEEAARDNISITDAKLHDGIAQIERQSHREPGSLEQFLTEKGLSKMSFYTQVKAQLAWSEIILKKVRPRVRISDQEIARYVARAAASNVKTKEVQIALIQLPVDSPDSEASTKKVADKLAASIQGGTDFNAVASQFSASTKGTRASEPFWVELSQLEPVIATALAQTPEGGIAGPLRTSGGYQIIKLMGTRETSKPGPAPANEPRAEIAYKQILMTLKPDAQTKEAELLLTLAREVAQQPGKCADKTLSGIGGMDAFDFKVTLTRAQSDELPEKLRALLLSLPVGGVSKPVITPDGIHIFMVCERMDLPPQNTPSAARDEGARRAIFEQKIELEAQKYMRDLRRDAFVEIRMQPSSSSSN